MGEEKKSLWTGVEKFQDVEQDFKAAMEAQSPILASRGRAAVLRMSPKRVPGIAKKEDSDKSNVGEQQSGDRIDNKPTDESLRDSKNNPNEEHKGWTKAWQGLKGAERESSLVPDAVIFDSPEAFETALDLASGSFFDRQLIILEDLGIDWVNLLGKVFNIPPRFFALHWTAPVNYFNNMVQLPLSQPLEQHFVMSYPEILTMVRTDASSAGMDYWLNCNSVRPLSNRLRTSQARKYVPSIVTETCEHLLSFWGSQDGSTAVMLVDPKPSDPNTALIRTRRDGVSRMTYVMSKTEKLDKILQRPLLSTSRSPVGQEDPVVARFPHDDLNTIIVHDITMNGIDREAGDGLGRRAARYPARLAIVDKQPGVGEPLKNVTSIVPIERQIFDELVQGHRAPTKALYPNRAVSWTRPARRLVLAKTSVMVSALAADTDELTIAAMQNIDDITKFDFENLGKEGKTWGSEWKSSFFTQLWNLREDQGLLGLDIARTRGVLTRLARIAVVGRDGVEDMGAQREKVSEEVIGEALDLAQWAELETTRKNAFGMISRTTDSYLQTVAATGAAYANIQATSSKQIARLATFFVPGSLVAAILAIPSFSGAGDVTKFWIFWAAAVPLAIIVGLLLMTDVSKGIARFWEKVKNWVYRLWFWFKSLFSKPRVTDRPPNIYDSLEVRRARKQAMLGLPAPKSKEVMVSENV